MENINTEYLKNLKNIKCRRPIHENAESKGFVNASLCGVVISIFIFSLLFNWQKIENYKINTRADNQTLNWMNANSIYEFKIQKLDDKFLYLSEFKNKVLLIVKLVNLLIIISLHFFESTFKHFAIVFLSFFYLEV